MRTVHPSLERVAGRRVLTAFSLCLAGLAAAAPLAGQRRAPTREAAPREAAGSSAPAVDGRQLLDRVEAVIGDRVVLVSTVRRELALNVGQRPMSPAERRREELEIMRQIAREEIWRQVGLVYGSENPERFEQLVDGYVDDYIAERIAEYGSHAEMDRQLREAGTSWEELRAERRSQVLLQAAQSFAVNARFGNDSRLLVTPREMLRYYKANRTLFAAIEHADVAWLSFPLAAKQAAETARAEWLEDPLAEVTDLAERHGATGRIAATVRQSEDDSNLALIKDFARTAQPGDVSEVLSNGRKLYVLSMLDRTSQEALSFDSPLAQTQIRDRLVRRKRLELENRILAWKSQSIVVEPRELFERR